MDGSKNSKKNIEKEMRGEQNRGICVKKCYCGKGNETLWRSIVVRPLPEIPGLPHLMVWGRRASSEELPDEFGLT